MDNTINFSHINLVAKRRLYQFIHFFKYLCASLYVRIFNIENDDLWLLAERGIDARDNTYVLYKYIKKYHPEIRIKFVISKDSFDFNRIDPKDVIIHKSWENYVAFVTAGKLISTHSYGYTSDFQLFSSLDKYDLVNLRGKKIYLTHFLLDGRTFTWNKKIRKIDLYFCSSSCDYNHILKISDYGTDIVKLIGTPRMDNLYNNRNIDLENTILVMPTWRLPFTSMSDEEFLKTRYFENYNKLLKDMRIIKYLQENGYKLLFYPHIEAQKFLKHFKSDAECVILGDANKYIVEDLLLKCKFMITDYSSVHLDFALLRKKIAYFQFDMDEEFKDRPWGTHFLYERDGFGPVFINYEDLISFILRQKTLSFDRKYEHNIKKIFPLFDNNNCKRAVELIKSL